MNISVVKPMIKKADIWNWCSRPLRTEEHNHDVQLLLDAMLGGLNDIENEYSRYISINEEDALNVKIKPSAFRS